MAEQTPENLFQILGCLVGGDLGPYTFYKNKRGLTVWFPKSPPLKPPSPKQTVQRNQFRIAGACWASLTPEQREQWNLAGRRASLCMTGYNLYLHFNTTGDQARRNTLAARTKTTLA